MCSLIIHHLEWFILTGGKLKIFKHLMLASFVNIHSGNSVGMLGGENDIWGAKIITLTSLKSLVSDCRAPLLAFVQLEKEV